MQRSYQLEFHHSTGWKTDHTEYPTLPVARQAIPAMKKRLENDHSGVRILEVVKTPVQGHIGPPSWR